MDNYLSGNRKRGQRVIRIISIISALVFYFSILNVISHVRGPIQYATNEAQQLAGIRDFVSFTGEKVEADNFQMSEPDAYGVIGYSGKVSLLGVNQLRATFHIMCPDEYAGSALTIDLYNPDMGYDSPEQEEIVLLEAGENQIIVDIQPGENAPYEAQLRIFTDAVVNLEVKEIEAYPLVECSKVTVPMVLAVVLSLIVTIVSTVMYKWRK